MVLCLLCLVVFFFFFDSAPSLFFVFFFFNDTATTEIYTLSLHDALPICQLLIITFLRTYQLPTPVVETAAPKIGKFIGLSNRSEEHTSELQSRETISYAVFCLKKKKTKKEENKIQRKTNQNKKRTKLG